MDNRNNGKMQSTKNRGKGVGTAKTKKAKIKIYVTVDYFQLLFPALRSTSRRVYAQKGSKAPDVAG